MKRLLSLFLIICLLAGCVLAVASCTQDTPDTPDNGEGDDGGTPTMPPDDETVIKIPEYKDYGRGSVNFSNLIYERPKMDRIIASVNTACESVKSPDATLQGILESLRSLENDQTTVETMYALAEINVSQNASLTVWQDEHLYISNKLPSYNQALEALLRACAKSPYKQELENEYFSYSLNSYLGDSVYSDELVELLQQEAELEARYSGMSTATVEITYQGTTATAGEFIKKLGEQYPVGSKDYNKRYTLYMTLYNAAAARITEDIFVELVKIRRLIADERGVSSYTELGYESAGHDYTSKQMIKLLEDTAEFIVPVRDKLAGIIGSYLASSKVPSVEYEEAVNDLYSIYKLMSPDTCDAFGYMLQHGLFDISVMSENRFDGAFTTYIENNNSPFLFVTAQDKISDYGKISHEFGHFLDGYINYGMNNSLNLSEVYSQGLELLTILRLDKKMLSSSYKYLKYLTIYDAMNVLYYQSYYAMFEHLVYALEYDDISKENLTEIARDAGRRIFGEDGEIDCMSISLSDALIVHTVESPFYTQAYCTSMIAALQIFFMEVEEENAGLEAYLQLVKRTEKKPDFVDEIERVGLESPFKDGILIEIANGLHYFIIGGPYYMKDTNDSNAA